MLSSQDNDDGDHASIYYPKAHDYKASASDTQLTKIFYQPPPAPASLPSVPSPLASPPLCPLPTQVACGGYHTLLLTVDGRVVTFGNNSFALPQLPE